MPDTAANILISRGLSLDFADSWGIRRIETEQELPAEFSGHPYATTPAWLFPRKGLDGQIRLQLRPDNPLENEEGKFVKYVFPVGSSLGLSELRETGSTALIVEGTCQSLAAVRYAAKSLSVYGIEGCWNWRNGELKIPAQGLEIFEDRKVIIALDADSSSNRLVYDAGMGLRDAVLAEGATEVLFLRLPGSSGTAGLDDVLGAKEESRRGPYLARLIKDARDKPADVKPNHKRKAPVLGHSKTSVPATDLDVSDAWLSRYGSTLRYNVTLQKWMAFHGGVWKTDAGISLAQASLQDCIRNDIVAVSEKNGLEIEWLHSAKRLQSVLAQGAANSSYQLSDDKMDTDPWLWNASDCVINLRTGQPTPHDPNLYMSQQSPVEFDPFARAPKFREWLEEVLPNRDTRRYVQKVFGIALVGKTLEHIFPVFIGTGRNGKGTLIRLMAAVFGQYFTGIKKSVLLDSKFEQHATALATLQHKRLATAEELKADAAYDIPTIKQLTGGDQITANRMRQDDISFKPSHLLLIASNHRPKVAQDEQAFWARYREIPFNAVFENPSDQVEEAMKTSEELSGILNWLLEGLKDYLVNGLGEPEEVMWASAEAKVASDPLYEFIDERVARAEGEFLKASDVREVYESYCVHRRIEPMRLRGFRQEFAVASGSDLKKVRDGDQTYPAYVGIRWTTEEDVPLLMAYVPNEKLNQGTNDLHLEQLLLTNVLSVPSVPPKNDYKSLTENISEPNKKPYSTYMSDIHGTRNIAGQDTHEERTLPGTPGFTGFELDIWADLGAVKYAPPVCEACGETFSLVPPGLFWYACMSCFPATFERN